jgi:hypothetical protein
MFKQSMLLIKTSKFFETIFETLKTIYFQKLEEYWHIKIKFWIKNRSQLVAFSNSKLIDKLNSKINSKLKHLNRNTTIND